MKRFLIFIALLVGAMQVNAQDIGNGTQRGIFRSVYILNRWIDSVVNDTANWEGKVRSIATVDAIQKKLNAFTAGGSWGITDTLLKYYRHVTIRNQNRVGGQANSLIISNTASDSSEYPFTHLNQGVTNTSYESSMFNFSKRYWESWGDTLNTPSYGGILTLYRENQYDSTSSRFKAGIKDITVPHTGIYGDYQLFFPRDSVRLFSGQFGQSGALFVGKFDFGDTFGYNVNTYSTVPGYTIAPFQASIDYMRRDSRGRRKRMTGEGVSGYIWDARFWQGSTIMAATYPEGSFLENITGVNLVGITNNHAGTDATKAQIMAVSMIKNARPLIIRPQRTNTNEVYNGYSILSEGTQDYGWLAGYLKVGGSRPGRESGGFNESTADVPYNFETEVAQIRHVNLYGRNWLRAMPGEGPKNVNLNLADSTWRLLVQSGYDDNAASLVLNGTHIGFGGDNRGGANINFTTLNDGFAGFWVSSQLRGANYTKEFLVDTLGVHLRRSLKLSLIDSSDQAVSTAWFRRWIATYGTGGGGGGPATLADGDYGDVTVSGSGTGITLDANVVTNAKAAQMATNTIKGNNTGGTANAADLSTTQVKTMLALNNVDNTSDAGKPVSSAQQSALDLKAPLASPTFTGTVAGITKSMVGLANVDNTSDASKPVSTAQQTALDLKANLASPTFTGTVGGISKSMVGLSNVDNTSDASKPVSTAQQTALDLKANLASPTFTGTVGGITKSMVGLGSVDNTSDAGKPVSTAQQTALDLKANLASPTFTGTVGGITKSMVGLSNVDNTSDATKNAASATLTNKTLTSPVINSPTGIVKGDVGLGNVDNTSDATKNAAAVTLTNKTLTAPVINSPTGIVKGDVGLGNVDNTSDATKNAATVNLTNKTLDATNTIAQAAITGLSASLAAKQDALVSATNIKTVNGNSLLGSGDVVISGGGTIDATPTNGSTNAVQSDGVFDALALKQGTLTNQSNIKSVYGQTLLGSGDVMQIRRNNSTVTMPNSTTATSFFASDFTLVAGTTYKFKMMFQHNSTGTTSHTERLQFTLTTATLSDIGYGAVKYPRVPSGTNVSTDWKTANTAQAITGAITTASDGWYIVEGTFRVNAGGTMAPQFSYSAGPGGTGTIGIGAYMELIPIGPASGDVSY